MLNLPLGEYAVFLKPDDELHKSYFEVLVLTELVALGRGAAFRAGHPRPVHVVLTGLDLVGLATLVRPIRPAYRTSQYTILFLAVNKSVNMY